jgi:GntR family transcriptional regulator, transcriptional repressor for pyruvate dehydrogenase complex
MEQTFVIHKKKLYEEVMEQISRMIKSEEYKAGERLPSLKELSSMFQVGQPTVREALSVLVAAGVIEIRHGSGIFIRQYNEDSVSDVTAAFEKVDAERLIYWLEYRRAVEVEIAGLAAARRTQHDIQFIEEAQLNLEQETRDGKVGAYWEYQFHHRLALATHNPIFSQAITATEEILRQYFELSKNQTFEPSRIEVVSKEHREILLPIIAGDSLEAKKAMLNHIENVRKRAKILSNMSPELLSRLRN